MAEPHLAKWDYMIQMARHKNEGHVIDLNETAETYNKQFRELGQTELAAATVAESVDPIAMPLGSKSEEERLVVVGRALGKLTPFTKYLDQFLDEYGYSQSVGYKA